MVGEAAHDLGAVVEMAFSIGREQAAGAVEGDPLAQTDERVEQPAIAWARTAHVPARDDGDAARRGESRRPAAGAGLAAIEQMRDVDREAIAEDGLRALEECFREPFIAADEHAPMPGERLELGPLDLDAIARPGISRFELFVAASVREGQ